MPRQDVKKSHRVQIVLMVFALLILALLAAFSWKVLSDRQNGMVPSLFGYRMFSADGNEMEPQIPKGSMIFLAQGEQAPYAANDVVLYEQDGTTMVRWVLRAKDEEGLLQLKGDGESGLVKVPEDEVIGAVSGYLPFGGYLLDLLEQQYGILWLLVVPAGVLLLIELLLVLAGMLHRRKTEGIETPFAIPDDQDEHFVDVTAQFVGEKEKPRLSGYQSPLAEKLSAVQEASAKPQPAADDRMDKLDFNPLTVEKAKQSGVQRVVISPPARQEPAEKKPEPIPQTAAAKLQIVIDGVEEANVSLNSARSFAIQSGEYEVAVSIRRKV